MICLDVVQQEVQAQWLFVTCKTWVQHVTIKDRKESHNFIQYLCKYCARKLDTSLLLDRNQTTGRLQAVQSNSEVARIFKVHHSTKTRLWDWFRRTNSTNGRPRSGRPRVTTPGQDQYIRVTHLRNRHRTAPDYSTRTVWSPSVRSDNQEPSPRSRNTCQTSKSCPLLDTTTSASTSEIV